MPLPARIARPVTALTPNCKHCVQCGAAHSPRAWQNQTEWDAAIYCGRVCAAKARAHSPEYVAGRYTVNESTGCWEFQGRKNDKGYGVHSSRCVGEIYAHRISWTLRRGPIPTGLVLLHRCDNPPCINPDHLFLGTQAENIDDMCAKGRHGTLRREANPRAKLTEGQVARIRSDLRRQVDIAADFGVSQSTVSSVKRGETWG